MKKLLIPGLVVFFIYYTIGCSPANSIGYVSSPIAFYFSQKPAVDGTGKSYVDLNDGQRIYGDKVDVGGNGFKIKIIVNHVKYNLDEVKDLQRGDEVYYTVFGRELFQTIVKGEKVGVYARSMSLSGSSGSSSVKKLYYSKNGKLTPLQSLKDVSNAIGDCNATQSVNSLTNDDLKKETKENDRFLNELFEKYNKDCK